MPITTPYVERFPHKGRPVAPPRTALAVIHARKPTVAYYRFLYNTVGQDWNWTSRGKRSDPDLARLIQDPQEEMHVLFVDGDPAGFAEPDRRVAGEIELLP